jgi:hypothetical protein
MGYLKLFRKRKYPSVSKDWGFVLNWGFILKNWGWAFDLKYYSLPCFGVQRSGLLTDYIESVNRN